MAIYNGLDSGFVGADERALITIKHLVREGVYPRELVRRAATVERFEIVLCHVGDELLDGLERRNPDGSVTWVLHRKGERRRGDLSLLSPTLWKPEQVFKLEIRNRTKEAHRFIAVLVSEEGPLEKTRAADEGEHIDRVCAALARGDVAGVSERTKSLGAARFCMACGAELAAESSPVVTVCMACAERGGPPPAQRGLVGEIEANALARGRAALARGDVAGIGERPRFVPMEMLDLTPAVATELAPCVYCGAAAMSEGLKDSAGFVVSTCLKCGATCARAPETRPIALAGVATCSRCGEPSHGCTCTPPVP